jgi:uncharacterized protein YggE
MSDTQLGRDRDRFAPRIIVVTGLGKISVKPGRTGLRLAVRTEGVTAAEAMARNAEAMARIMEAVRANQPEAQIETSGFSLSPRYSQTERKMIGFEAFHQLAVPMTDLQKMGEVVDKAVLAGANVVNVEPFTSQEEDLNESTRIGLERALADASSKAEVIARALGVKIAGVHHVVEEYQSREGPHPRGLGAEARVATTIVPPSESEMRVTVRAAFMIST